MKFILYLSMFLTLYLTMYFLTNFKPNAVTVVRNRITHLRNRLFDQLYINKSSSDRAKWILELEQRRSEIHLELKNNLRMTKRSEKTINSIIDNSWDELLAIMKAGSQEVFVPQKDKPEVISRESDGMDVMEEIEEIDEIEDAEELGEIEEIDELGEIEEVGEIEEIDELGEIEEVGEIEEIDELGEIEEAGEIEEVDELGEIEEAGEIKEVEQVDEAGEIEEVEELGEIKETVEIPVELKKSDEGLNNIADFDEVVVEADSAPKGRRGLLALASEIEFNREYPVIEEDEGEEFDDSDVDIVSPFASMFSSLEEKKTKRKRRSRKNT
jgi:hypothetical protein